jgi:hypothetical protein
MTAFLTNRKGLLGADKSSSFMKPNPNRPLAITFSIKGGNPSARMK